MNGDLSTSCNLSNCDCDKPKPMTDQRARTAQLWCLPQHSHKEMDVDFAESIAQALADERRRVLDEIGDQLDQLGDWYFNEGNTQARLAVEKVEQFLNEYAKAHAGQEG